MKNVLSRKYIGLGFLLVTLGIGASLWLLRIKANQAFQTYTNEELNFAIDYPTNWTVQAGRLGDAPRTPYVDLNGTFSRVPFSLFHNNRDSCDVPDESAQMNVSVSAGMNHRQFGQIGTEDDIRRFFNTKGGVIEEISLQDGRNLIVGHAYTGTGMCNRSVFIAWTFSKDGKLYMLVYSGDNRASADELYPIAQRMFHSFRFVK